MEQIRSTTPLATVVRASYATAEGSAAKPADVLAVRAREADLFAWIRVVCDCVALMLAWGATEKLLEAWRSGPPAGEAARLLPMLLAALSIWTAAASWAHFRRQPAQLTAKAGLLRSLRSAAIIAAAALFAAAFVAPQDRPAARLAAVLFAATSLLLLFLAQCAALAIVSTARTSPRFAERVALMGDDEACERVGARMRQETNENVRILGVIVPDDSIGDSVPRQFRVLGREEQLAELINREGIDRVVLANDQLDLHEVEKRIAIANRMGVTVTLPLSITSDCGMRLAHCRPPASTPHEPATKRILDVATALALLILFAPLMIVLAILIKLTSPGPVFYRSVRVGVGGRHFVCWKFRSMRHGSARAQVAAANEQQGHMFKVRNDPRVTALGKYMRKFSLDELPQLFNVLLGEMSVVGPRPLPAEDLDPDGLSKEHRHWAEARARVRPGITGLWQTSGRSNVSFEEMMQMDIEYLERRSPGLDIRIMLATPAVMWSGRGAY